MMLRLRAIVSGLLLLAFVTGQDAPPAPPVAAPTTAAEAAAAPDEAAIPLGQPEAEPEEPALPRATATSSRPAGVASLAIPAGGNVAVIPIEGMIYDFTLRTIERRVEAALGAGASIIVFEIDTPGGVMTSALEISRVIKKIPAPTVAWINDQAYSAGILIASACDQIVMAPSSATGDAAPVSLVGNLAPTERAKVLSPLLEEFRDNAAQNGYDYTLFHAMCTLGVEVYLIEHTQTGERRAVNQLDYAALVEGRDPTRPLATPTGPTLSTRAPAVDPDAFEDIGAVTLEEKPATPGEWKLVAQINDGKSLLTLSQTRALDVGLAQAIVKDQAELLTYLQGGAITTVGQHWIEEIAFWLMHPAVRGVLLLVFLVCAYLEFQAPGVGVFGGLSLLALGLLLGAPFMVGMAQAWHLVVVVLGIGLLILELAYLPGFGLLGVAGVAMMLIGLAFAAVPSGPSFGPAGGLPATEMWGQAALALLYMVFGLVSSLGAMFFLAKHFGELPFFGKMVLRNPVPLPAGAPLPAVSGEDTIGGGLVAVGDTGRTMTELRPTGRADLRGEVVDVVSEGGWIDAGTPIRVIEVHGNRIVVVGA